MIDVTCPHCNADLKIPDQYAGQKGKCNKCGNEIVVPAFNVEEAFPGDEDVHPTQPPSLKELEKRVEGKHRAKDLNRSKGERDFRLVKWLRVGYFIVFAVALIIGGLWQVSLEDVGLLGSGVDPILQPFLIVNWLLFTFLFVAAMRILECSLTEQISTLIVFTLPYSYMLLMAVFGLLGLQDLLPHARTMVYVDRVLLYVWYFSSVYIFIEINKEIADYLSIGK